MAEVIGVISGVITLIDASIKICTGLQKDIKLSKTSEAIQTRLLVNKGILEECQSSLEQRRFPLRDSRAEPLTQVVVACEDKAKRLMEILKNVNRESRDGFRKRLLGAFQALGKGGEVEKLSDAIDKDVQVIVNHHVMKTALDQKKRRDEETAKEIEPIKNLEERLSRMAIHNDGNGNQKNNINCNGGDINDQRGTVINNGRIEAMNISISGGVIVLAKADLQFLPQGQNSLPQKRAGAKREALESPRKA